MAKSKASKDKAAQQRLFGARYVRRTKARQRKAEAFNAAMKAQDAGAMLDVVRAIDADPAMRRSFGRWMRTNYKTHLGALYAELYAALRRQADANT